jgi:leader peptidase (prepilin peptidase)/N-methyltransferase
MEYFLTIFPVFVLGAIIGSFLNVVIMRMNTGATLAGRSGCFSCGQTLSPLQMVPIISFFLLRAKCAGCGSKISWQYPIVEILTGTLFVLVFTMGLSLPQFFLALCIISTLIVVAVYDFHHTIIPNIPIYAFIALAILYRGLELMVVAGFLDAAVNIVVGATITTAPIFALWFFSRGKWMGGGDVKIAIGIGSVLGAYAGTQALFLAFLSGAIVGLVLIAFSKFLRKFSITLKSEIPFAPFLIFGFFVMFIWPIDIMQLIV